jgi:hypothetical protein
MTTIGHNPTIWRARQRRPSHLDADVKEIVAPTSIDARQRLSRYARCGFSPKFFLTAGAMKELARWVWRLGITPSAGEEPVLEDGLRLVRADVTLTMTLPKVRRTESGGRALRRKFFENFSSRKFVKFSQDFETRAVN